MRITKTQAWKFFASRIVEQAGLDIVAGRGQPEGSRAWKVGMSARTFVEGEEWDLFSSICTALRQDPDVARSRMLSPYYNASGIDAGRVDKWV